MGPRTIVVLALLTLSAVAAAAAALVLESADRLDARIGEPVFPELFDNANDVASIAIDSRRGKLTIERDSDGWRLVESDRFKVMTLKAKGSILDLASLKYYEQKTAKPEKYAQLLLRDIAEEGSESKHVTLKNAAGDVMAELIVGLGKNSLPGTDTGGTFIRLPGDKRTWLAQGGVNFGELPSDWLDREIFSIVGDRIKRAEILQPNGESLVITKRVPASLVYTLNAKPQGTKVKYEEEPALIATNLEQFTVEDVRRKGAVTFAPGKTYRAVFETFDGLQAVAEVAIDDRQGWVRFMFSGAGDAAEEAKELNERTKDWVYRIAGFRTERLTKRLADMLTPVTLETN